MLNCRNEPNLLDTFCGAGKQGVTVAFSAAMQPRRLSVFMRAAPRNPSTCYWVDLANGNFSAAMFDSRGSIFNDAPQLS